MRHLQETDRGMYCSTCGEQIHNVKNINHQLSERDWKICTKCAPIKEVKRYHGF